MYKRLVSVWCILVVLFYAFLFVEIANGQGDSLTASPSSVQPGQQISVTWTITQPTGNDWVSLHPVSDDESNSHNMGYQTIVDQDGGGITGGTLTFAAPNNPGQYNFRLFRNSSRVAVSNTVTVVAQQQPTAVPVQPTAVPPIGPTQIPHPQGCGNDLTNGIPQARQANVPGGFDLITVAYGLCYSGVRNDTGRWDGWVMFGNGKSDFHLGIGEFKTVCVFVYGLDWTVDPNTVGGNHGQNDVRCIQNQPVPTTVPVIQPTAQSPNCNNVLPTHLKPGDTVYEQLPGENLQAGPHYNEKVEGVIYQNVQAFVTSGPQCNDGWQWVQIQIPSMNVTWWAIEGDNKSYWLDKGTVGSNPTPPPPPPGNNCSSLQSRVSVGQIAINTSGVDLHMKNTPQTTASSNGVVPNGAQFSIVSGPQCGEARTWWQIGYQGIVGWLPESNSNVYNFSPNQQPINTPLPPPPVSTDCNGDLPLQLKLGDTATASYKLNLRAGDGLNQPLIATLPAGSSVVIVSGPRCTDGYQWWQVQSSLGIWWTVDSVGNVRSFSKTGSQPVNPPTAQPIQPTQTPQPQVGVPCGNTYNNSSNGNIWISYTRQSAPPSCFQYVASVYPAFFTCLTHAGWQRSLNDSDKNTDRWAGAYNIATWAERAPECSVSVNQGTELNLKNLATREWLIVWSRGCANFYDVDNGHVAIFVGFYGESLTVDESNLPEGSGPAIHSRQLFPGELSCATFIHVGLPPGNKQVASRIVSSAVNISCISCNTLNNWVEFNLPNSEYLRSSFSIHFLPSPGTAIHFSLVPGGFPEEFRLDQLTINTLAATGGITLSQLNDSTNWYATWQ